MVLPVCEPRLVSGLVLSLIVLLTGCVSAPNGADAAAPDAEPSLPTVLPWGYADCDAAIAIIDVPEAALEPHLPEGFEVMTLEEANGPPGVRGEAAFGVEVLYCADGVGLNGTTGAVAYGSYWTFVHPPKDLHDVNATFHFYKWDVLIQDKDLRLKLQEAGVPARDATTDAATPAVFEQTPVGVGAFQMGFFWDGDTTQTVSVNGGSSAAPFGNEDIVFKEFTDTPFGLVEWRTQMVSKMYVSAGYVRLPLDGLAGAVVGEERVAAAIVAGPASFNDGTITLPAVAAPTADVAA